MTLYLIENDEYIGEMALDHRPAIGEILNQEFEVLDILESESETSNLTVKVISL